MNRSKCEGESGSRRALRGGERRRCGAAGQGAESAPARGEEVAEEEGGARRVKRGRGRRSSKCFPSPKRHFPLESE